MSDSTVTREDINLLRSDIKDLYDKYNEMSRQFASIEKHLAVIATKFEALPAPPKQPCKWVEGVIKDFDEYKKDQQVKKEKDLNNWKQPAIRLLFNVLQWVIIAGISAGIGILVGTKL